MFLFTYCSDILVCSSKTYLDSSHPKKYKRLIEITAAENLNSERKKKKLLFVPSLGLLFQVLGLF